MFENFDEKIMPVEEMMNYDEFTDRVNILRELEEWVRDIKKMLSGSTTLISPRRMGKTSLLDRLVNTVFFKDYNVAPFYFKMKREQATLRKFLLEYATTFFRQYIAYCIQDPELYKNDALELSELFDIVSEHKAVKIAKEFIVQFLKRYNGNDHQDARNHWDAFIKEPERLASASGTWVAVIIDEFQDMKFYIYDTDEIPEDKSQMPAVTNLTATYDRQAQSRKAPMLVSGSAVTLIFRTVMGGPLGGRFGFTYLKPLAIPDGAALITKLLVARGLEISEENAIYISSEVRGHPYYLYCCAVSASTDKSFETKEDIDRLIEYEVKKGKIFGFWETHFAYNKQYINNDNDISLGKKIIYSFAKYINNPVQVDEIAKRLDVSESLVEEKIEKLYMADLVYRSDFKYYTFNDIMLMRYIQYRFEKDIENLERINLKKQGIFNVVKGKFLELVVENIMSKFNGEELEGRLFGHEGKVVVPLFRRMGSKTVQPDNSRQYQVDVFGKWEHGLKSERRRGLWTIECKYRKQLMSLDEVKKALEASKAFLNAEYKDPTNVQLKVWLVSTGGFTVDALKFLGDSDVYFSGHEEINEIFRMYGGIRIPIFEE